MDGYYYRRLFNQARDVILMLDLDGRIIDFNQAAVTQYGYAGEELKEKTIFDLRADGCEPSIRLQMQMAADDGMIFDAFHKNKNGKVFPAEVSSKSVVIDGEKFLLSVVRDITARKEAEDIIRRQNEKLVLLHEISLDMLGDLDLDKTLGKIAASLERLIKGSRGYIALVDEREGKMSYAVGPRRVANTFEKGAGMIGRVWASGLPQVVADYRVWEDRLPGRYSRFTTVAGVPIKQRQETVGVLGVYFYRKIRPFTDEELAVLAQYAELAAVALNNAKLHGALQKELAERRKAEEALAASQQHYQAIFDNCQDALFFYELEETGMPGKYREVNRTAVERLGFTREELLARTPADVNTPDSVRKIPSVMEGLKTRDTVMAEAVHMTKGGRRIPVEINAHRFIYNGRPMVLSVARDIGERKRREDQEALVREVALGILEEKPLEEILQHVCQRVTEIFGLRYAWIGLTEPNGSLDVYAATEDARQYLTRVKVRWDDSPEGSGTVGSAIKSGRTMIQDYDHPRVQLWAPAARAMGVAECAAVPIKVREKTIGALVLYAGEAAGFSEELLAHLETLAGQTAMAINAARSRQHLKLLTEALEAAVNGVVITDRRGRFIWANHAFYRITGRDYVEMYRKNIGMLRSDQHTREFYAAIWKMIAAGWVWEGEITSRRKDGTIFFEETTFAPVRDDQGEIVNFVAVINDITERKRMEHELQENRRKVAQTEKLISLGTLAAGIAHEINQPLNVIKMLADGIKFLHERGKIGLTGILVQVGEISAQADRIDGIIRHMRTLVFEKHRLTAGSADLNETVTGAIELVLDQLAAHDIAVKPDLGTVPRVRGDKPRLEEVVVNLVTNAVKALGGSAGAGREITITTRRQGEMVALEVRDNGPGIDVAIRDKIFEPFFTTQETGAGMGMGLAIAHAVVTSCGGTITAGDNAPRGTVIRIELPPA